MRVVGHFHHASVPSSTTLASFRGVEGLSRLFDLTVEILCDEPDLDLESMLGSTASVVLESEQGASGPRAFHGVVEEARALGAELEWYRYSFRLRPSVHGLAYRVRSRIFQDLNVIDIVSRVLSDAGIPSDAVRWSTTGQYPVREYCTQWKESELDFILRLLEEEGIFFWFEHTEVDHVLVFGDDPSVHESIDDPLIPAQQHADQEKESLWACVLETRLTHDRFESRDFFWETPGTALTAAAGEDGVRTRYEYPGGYTDQGEGARRAQIRLEEEWAERMVLRAACDVARIEPGKKFELYGVHPELLAREYVVISAEHTFKIDARIVGGISRHGTWQQVIRAIPSDRPYRPARITPKPIASGLESAVVTGPGGEEIYVDEFGRIKVHFYWDREQPVDDSASCWLRVQQLNTQGAMILPRVGWEVHVAFENGDPDRPIAFHKAYNQETMPPYGLPANKTQSALQSSTSPGGGSTNEIRLQDGNGGMEFFVHASKDLEVTVANDETETVGVDATESVGNTMTIQVGGDESGAIGGHQSLSVSAQAAMQTVGSKSLSVGGNDDWGIKGDFGFQTGADRTETIGGLMNVLANSVSEVFNGSHTRNVGAVQAIISATAIAETVGGSKTETVSAAKAILTPGGYQEEIGATKTLTSGAVTFKTGGDLSYTAKGGIALTSAGVIKIKCGEDAMFTGSQIRVTSGSAKMKGGGGSFKLGGNITIDAKKFGGESGPMLKIKGTIDYKG